MNYTPRHDENGRRKVRSLFPDSWDQDKHQSLKRWERFAQRSAWKARARETAAPPLPCYWRPEDPVLGQAHLLALFEGDLALVRFVGPLEASAGVRVLRGGIPWDQWTASILRAWLAGAAVPDPFRPRRRLPPQWLEQALAAGPADQKSFFDRLRSAGILQPLIKISAEGVTPWLAWDEVRARFVDFHV